MSNKNPQAEEDFVNDPLNYTGKINAKTGCQILKLVENF